MINASCFEVERLSDLLVRVRMPGDVFAYIAEGAERAAVIDTGCGLGPYRAFVEERLNGKPYDLILTHGHVDHAGGASEFDRAWMRPEDLPTAAEHTQKAMRADYIRRSFHEPFTEDDMPAPKADGYDVLRPGQTFELGGETLEIVDLSGHTPGSVGILFQNARTLLAGDACCSLTLLFANGASLSVRDYQAHLRRAWEAYKDRVDHMLYSHPHNYGGPEVIPQMIALCGEILDDRDARIPSPGLFGPSYLAKPMGEDVRRLDGQIANLVYTQDNL